MEENQSNRLTQIEQKLDVIYQSTETTRKYIKWTIIITAILFFLPLIGLIFIIPVFLTTMSQMVNLGGL